jgi:phospholipid N-methyltransferase
VTGPRTAAGILLATVAGGPGQHVAVPRPARPAGQVAADRRAMRRAFTRDWRAVGTLWPTGDSAAGALLDLAGDAWKTAGRIVEAGAGTGPITSRIIQRAPAAAVVDVFEVDAELRAVTAARYGRRPGVRLHGDIAGLPSVLDGGRADVIVSALPWSSFPPPRRRELLAMLGGQLAPGGVLLVLQYTRHCEPAFRGCFADVTRRRHGTLRWPVLYRLASPAG